MAYQKQNWVNDVTDVDATNMNHIEDGIEKAYGVELLAVVDTAPSECSVGDKYFNTTTNKIYEATATDTWDTEGYDAESGVFYVVFSERAIYTYNGTTLIGVGSSGAGGESIPVGSILAFAGENAPEGYLMCDGSSVSRTTYGELFNVIGTTYGYGSSNTETFQVPNIKGRVLVGLDSTQTEFDTLGEKGGSKELQAHTHSIKVNDGGSTGSGGYITTTSNLSYITSAQSINSAGTGDSGNLQPYIVVNYIIKAHPSAVNTSEVVNEHSTSETDVYSANYVNGIIEGTILYNNATGSAGNITLNDNIENYTIFSIEFNTPSNYVGYVTYKVVSGATYTLDKIRIDSSSFIVYQEKIQITNKAISVLTNRTFEAPNTITNDNDVLITKVIGYK